MMILETIGENAGKVWRLLNAKGAPTTFTELQQQTGLAECEMYAAIGWLAREGKVFFEENEGCTRVSLHPVNVYF